MHRFRMAAPNYVIAVETSRTTRKKYSFCRPMKYKETVFQMFSM